MPIPWFSVATHFKGLSEVHGAVSNPNIVEMFRVSGHPEITDDETPWCAAFVGACLRLSGFKSSGLLGARSYATFGQELNVPQRGAIVVFWRTSPQSGSGHVAFFDHDEGDHICVLGGNQCDSVSLARFPKARVIGYRQPVETAPLPDSTLPNILTIDPANAPIHLIKPQVATGPAPLSPKARDALSEGAVGASVQSLQAALVSRGFQINVDGEFGPQTRVAVAGFQSQQGLPSTGVADDATLLRLGISTSVAGVVPAPQQPPLPDLSRTERLVEALLTTVLSRQQQAASGTSPSDEITRFLKLLAEAKAPGATAPASANIDADQVLQTLVRIAAARAADGKTPAAVAGSGANIAQVLQTLAPLLNAGTTAAARSTSAATGAAAASNVLLSPIDTVLGGQALAGKKTALAVVAYAALAIFQSLGVVGNATGADASTTGQVLTTLIGAFGALGGLAKVDRIVRALAVIAVK